VFAFGATDIVAQCEEILAFAPAQTYGVFDGD
jgi:hypothetical protein